jgi:hypothetical protein
MPATSSLAIKARLAALSLAFALLAACGSSQSASQGPYYATISNPHPELPGFPKIARSDVRIYANLFDPHPEITMPHAGVFATGGSGAPAQPPAVRANLSESGTQTN